MHLCHDYCWCGQLMSLFSREIWDNLNRLGKLAVDLVEATTTAPVDTNPNPNPNHVDTEICGELGGQSLPQALFVNHVVVLCRG